MKKSEKTGLTVKKILDSAVEEFGTKGYSQGRINSICSSGINKGLIYHNFAGKDELYLECVRLSCESFLHFIDETDGAGSLASYMTARMQFCKAHPLDAHIFFEALLSPPPHLFGEISEALSGFDELNESICLAAIDDLTLRDGVTRQDALEYFRQMQTMFNGCFAGPAYRDMLLDEKVKIHEENIPTLLQRMLYGIAKEVK